jgi:hypothetical protein
VQVDAEQPLEVEDVVPPAFSEGGLLEFDGVKRLEGYLPREVWQRRTAFFFEGMRMEIGPCHRRYPEPPFFQDATERNGGQTRVDEKGNLLGYAGKGLPFPWAQIADDDPQAGQKWAWNLRYRYLGAGFRGPFRILHLERRGRKVSRYVGKMTFLPLHGVPGSDPEGDRFAWAGKFKSPEAARGVAWRQYRSGDTDRNWKHPDELFVYLPEERRVRRAPPLGVDGLFVPSYTRGVVTGGGKLMLPGAEISTADPSIAVGEHWRRGFVGLLIRPNAYTFRLLRVQDVISPINSYRAGFPKQRDRSYGPTGLSLANDRWEIRRAVVIEGERKAEAGGVARLKLWIDVVTAQPLYLVSYRSKHQILEVGIFMGRFSSDDPRRVQWDGNSPSYGAILPVAASFWVVADQSWLRESFDLRMDPMTDEDHRKVMHSSTLQKEGH